MVGRFTAHMNHVMGLQRLVASDKADYTRIVVELGNSDQVSACAELATLLPVVPGPLSRELCLVVH